MAGILFEDIFDVKDIDPDGKKFDRGAWHAYIPCILYTDTARQSKFISIAQFRHKTTTCAHNYTKIH